MGEAQVSDPTANPTTYGCAHFVGPDHANVATGLENYARLLRAMGSEEQAAKLEARAKAIRARHAREGPTK